MNRMILKILKVISFVCIVILLLEIGYFIYLNYLRQDEYNYFDGINDFVYLDDSYIAVGSNNDNDKHFEKAKITKYNQKKEKVWEKVFNKGYNGAYFGVASDGEDIVAVGSFESSKFEHRNSFRTALLVKYDSLGKVLFEKEFQILDNSKFTNVLVVDDGYIVTGQSIYSDMTLGTSEEGGAFLLKYDKEGKLVWKSNYGSSRTAIYNNLVVDDSYIYAVGKDDSKIGIVSKYDMFGNHLITTKYSDTDTLGFSGVVLLDDELIITGSKSIDANDSATVALIVKYDLNCSYIGEVTYESNGIERFNEVIRDANNDIVVIGTTAIYNKKASTNKKGLMYNGLIGKYKSNLKKVSVLEYGDEQDDYFTTVKLVDNNYLVSGYSSYNEDGYLSKFITYSDALKVLEVK